MYKYGVHAYLWSADLDRDIPWVAEKARRLGYDSLELPLNLIDRVDVPLAKRALTGQGLECTVVTGLAPDQNIVSPDPKTRQKGMDYLKRCIDIAAELGSGLVSGVLYAAWGELPGRSRTQEEWERSVENVRTVAEYARPAGVVLGMEPVNRFETHFLNTTEDGIRFVQDVGAENVKLLLDTYHLNIEEKTFHEPFLQARSLVAHVHACENDRGTPGTGHVDWHGVFRALADIGYQGYIVVESFVPDIEEIAVSCAIWRQIAPSADALAQDGLKFLKEMEARVAEEWRNP